MAGAEKFEIKPVKGHIICSTASQGTAFSHVMFQCPSRREKRFDLADRDGNLDRAGRSGAIVGTDLDTTKTRFRMSKSAPMSTPTRSITEKTSANFAGLRAYSDHGDFIIGPDKQAENFINIAGMKTPGLTSAAAIRVGYTRYDPRVRDGIEAEKRGRHDPREGAFCLGERSRTAGAIAKNPAYGRIVCRCNTIRKARCSTRCTARFRRRPSTA